MPFQFEMLLTNGQPLRLALDAGQTLFVLGANGTGKSSLLQRFYTQNRAGSRRITAHRQTWFETNAVTMSARDKLNTQNNIFNTDMHPQARWMDQFAAQRASLAIYDLIDAENVRARGIARAADDGDYDGVKELVKAEAPIKQINALLRSSNIPIEISVREAEQVMARRHGGAEYSVTELSDGERNALLIAASVLTAPQGSLLLIDEPERHLHRSIISPLLTSLFNLRADCSFVISTHDMMLAMDSPTAQVMLVRSCQYVGQQVTGWEADLLPRDAQIDEQLRFDILGARRKLLLVEGAEHSLDKPLYSILFPNTSVVAKSSCKDVEQNVGSIRASEDLHWLRAFGIVDNDRRAVADIERLKAHGVYAVPVFSIESIYYSVDIQRRVCMRHVATVGGDVEALLNAANDAALQTIEPHIQRLSERTVENKIRHDLMSQLPRRQDIARAENIQINIDVPQVVADEVAQLREYREQGNLAEIIARYPVRETPALDIIANRLGFQSRAQYESAVRRLLQDNTEALQTVQGFFGTLAADIAAA